MEPHWICVNCGYVYRAEEGDPSQGIPPGTAFAALPDEWRCPVCYVGKEEFDPE